MSPVATWRSTEIAFSTSGLISAGVTFSRSSKYLEFLVTYSVMMAANWSGSGSFGNVGVLNCFTNVQYLCSEVVRAEDVLPPPRQPPPTTPVRHIASTSAFPRVPFTVPPPPIGFRPPDPVGPGLAHRAFGWAGPTWSHRVMVAWPARLRNSRLPDENRDRT